MNLTKFLEEILVGVNKILNTNFLFKDVLKQMKYVSSLGNNAAKLEEGAISTV